ncbi:MAG: hypothetical protein JWN78_1374 [Bacteroidota bacterium]|nr:hypothetical protein [Bacteroidota bacterium]
MKKLLLVLLCIITIQTVTFSQASKLTDEEKKKIADTVQGWKFGGTGAITLNQAAFVNWSAGGSNSLAFLFNLRFYADYKKDRHLWQNWIAAEYGFQRIFEKGEKFTKSADRWEVFSKYGYKIYKPLYVAAFVDLRSQFNKTKFPKTDSIVSRFASPIVFEAAIGLDYVPCDHFSLFMSPIATKITYVSDDFIASQGAFGNIPPSKIKKEFGAVLLASYKQEFWKNNISLSSILKVYKNYLHGAGETRENYRRNIDVDWQTTIGMKVNKFLSASIFTQLIWDNDQLIKNKDTGVPERKIQFRDVIGVGLSYNPNFYKVKGEKAKSL